MPPLVVPGRTEAPGPDKRGVEASAHIQASGQQHGSAGEHSALEEHVKRMNRHLTGSIYLWACGEKPEEQSKEVTESDVVIGWLIPLVRQSEHGI